MPLIPFPSWPQKQTAPNLCEVCGKRPKFVEGNVEHPYCSRSCARNIAGNAPVACKFPNCKNTGKPALSGYCSQAHARDAPRAEPQLPPQTSAVLRELDANGPTFKELESVLLTRWRSRSTPTLRKVYEITDTPANRKRYEDFRGRLAKTDPIEEIKTFYGHQCICNLGVNKPVLCDFKSCGICMVVKSSFRRFAFDRKVDHGTLGDGIYTCYDSATADTSATSCTTSPYRVMVVCRVVRANNAGVFASVDPVFCHTADEILPEYIVMYEKA